MIKFVTPEEGKEIAYKRFYLGERVGVRGTEGKIVAIDIEDNEYNFSVFVDGFTPKKSNETSYHFETFALEEMKGYTYEWFDAGDLTSLKPKKSNPTKLQHITVPVTVKFDSTEILKSLKSCIPKPHTPQLSFQRDVEYDCVKYITIDNHTTLCINEISGDVGISYLHPDDTFNPEIAKALAFYRCEHKATSESLRKDSKRKIF
jgi:hypothetical protein